MTVQSLWVSPVILSVDFDLRATNQFRISKIQRTVTFHGISILITCTFSETKVRLSLILNGMVFGQLSLSTAAHVYFGRFFNTVANNHCFSRDKKVIKCWSLMLCEKSLWISSYSSRVGYKEMKWKHKITLAIFSEMFIKYYVYANQRVWKKCAC